MRHHRLSGRARRRARGGELLHPRTYEMLSSEIELPAVHAATPSTHISHRRSRYELPHLARRHRAPRQCRHGQNGALLADRLALFASLVLVPDIHRGQAPLPPK